MTYIDHAAEAYQHIKRAYEVQEEEGRTERSATDLALLAQAHATLALDEQQRIANLVALANALHMSEAYDDTTEASREAAYALIEYVQIDPDDEHPVIHPDIAAALGIGGGS